MKRLGTIIACMSLIVLLMISSYAADKNTYYIEECSLSVDIPNLFVVFTRDTDASDPNLDRLGLSWNELSSVFNERSMYLDAIDENGVTEIYITMVESQFPDFSQLSDTQLRTFASGLQSEFADRGVTVVDYDVYTHNGVKYIKLAEKNGTDLAQQYYTTVDGKAISITLASYAGAISSQQKAIVQGVVDSAMFDAEPVSTPKMEETDEFVYKDQEGFVEFTVPANWTEKPLSQEREFIDTKFMANDEAGLSIMYGSSDAWNDWLTDEDREGYTRSDMDNSAFLPEDFAQMLGVESDEVVTKTFGGKEYFYNVSSQTNSTSGLDLTVDMTTVMRFYNGYYYQFQFMGNEEDEHYKDFVSLLESVKYINEGDKTVGNDSIEEEERDGQTGLSNNNTKDAIIVIAFIALVATCAFLIWRRNNKKKDKVHEPAIIDERSKKDQEPIFVKPNAVSKPEEKDSSISAIMEKEQRVEQIKSEGVEIVCPVCKQVLDDDSKFCPYCGTKIVDGKGGQNE